MKLDPSKFDLSIDVDGNWCHQGEVITHPRVLAMLYSALYCDGSTHQVRTEGLTLPVRVADCPYVVLSVRHKPDGIVLLLTDGTHEALDAATLTIDERNVPRTRVKKGRFAARFSRTAWVQLAEAIIADGEGYVLQVGVVKVPLHVPVPAQPTT